MSNKHKKILHGQCHLGKSYECLRTLKYKDKIDQWLTETKRNKVQAVCILLEVL